MKKPVQSNLKFLAFAAALSISAFSLSSCAERPHPFGKPMAQQTFEHVVPFRLAVSDVAIENNYNLDRFPGDISSSLPLPPHTAILDFARARYKSTQIDGDIFRFVLEEAVVTKRVIPQQSPWVKWTGLADEDEYRFQISIDVYRVSLGQFSGPGAQIKMERTLVIPQRKSIAEREALQIDFVNQLVHDIDQRVMQTAREGLGL